MKPLSVYLAGDVDKESKWRKQAMLKLRDAPIIIYSPKELVKYTNGSLGYHHERYRTFVIEDLMKVEWSDIVFAYMSKKSKSNYNGTTSEIVWGKAHGRRIFMVCDFPKKKQLRYPFPLALADKIFKTLEEGLDILCDMAINMQYQPKEE